MEYTNYCAIVDISALKMLEKVDYCKRWCLLVGVLFTASLVIWKYNISKVSG